MTGRETTIRLLYNRSSGDSSTDEITMRGIPPRSLNRAFGGRRPERNEGAPALGDYPSIAKGSDSFDDISRSPRRTFFTDHLEYNIRYIAVSKWLNRHVLNAIHGFRLQALMIQLLT